MAFESLTERLQNVFKNLRRKGKISESDIQEATKEIRLALLEADVALPVVKDFIKKVRERAIGHEVIETLNPAQQIVKIVDEELTAVLGSETSELIKSPKIPTIIMMAGLQGAGKTTFTRYFLQSLGHQGSVKSPTYTLVEPYTINGQEVFHFDLYRLDDPYELELMGIRDYLETPNGLFLFEWPSKGGDEIPQADVVIDIQKSDDELTRFVTLTTTSEPLAQILQEQLNGA